MVMCFPIRTWAKRPAVGMPLSMTRGGTGAWINFSHPRHTPFAPYMTLDLEHTG